MTVQNITRKLAFCPVRSTGNTILKNRTLYGLSLKVQLNLLPRESWGSVFHLQRAGLDKISVPCQL